MSTTHTARSRQRTTRRTAMAHTTTTARSHRATAARQNRSDVAPPLVVAPIEVVEKVIVKSSPLRASRAGDSDDHLAAYFRQLAMHELLTPEDERAFFDDPYGTASRPFTAASGGLVLTNQSAGTNRVARRARPNEAALVQARREGLNLDGEVPEARNLEPARPLLRDPALALALDLLKGLAVVRASRP